MPHEQRRYGDTDLSNVSKEAFEEDEGDGLLPPSQSFKIGSVAVDYSFIDNPGLYIPERTAPLEYNPAENTENRPHPQGEHEEYRQYIDGGKKALEEAMESENNSGKDVLAGKYDSARKSFIAAAGFRDTLDPFSTLDLAYCMDRIIELGEVKPYENEAREIDRAGEWSDMSRQLYNLAWQMIADESDVPVQVNAALVIAERLEAVHADADRAYRVLGDAKNRVSLSGENKELDKVITVFAAADHNKKQAVAAQAMHNLITSSHRVPVLV